MQTDSLGCGELRILLLAAFAYLEKNRPILDSLNVFPVPDGDTGVNMVSTLKSAIESIERAGHSSIAALLAELDRLCTANSRGNSGFILARFFHGFAESIGNHSAITAAVITRAFANGAYLAKTSLSAPQEGTMITIIAACVAGMRATASPDILPVLQRGLAAARERLQETPKLLPVLARAGVVDSGALGFIFLLEGMVRGLDGRDVRQEQESDYRFPPDPAMADGAVAAVPYRYCTELTAVCSSSRPLHALQSFLAERGDSIALLADEGLIKVHVHTDTPHAVIAEMQKFGPLVKTKIEDMREQMDRTLKAMSRHRDATVLAIIPGAGFSAVYREFGVHHFLTYADTLPSCAEILTALEGIDSDRVIVLPNERALLPAVTLARDGTEKKIAILPTQNVIQGLAALYGFSDRDSPDANIRNMAAAIEFAVCVTISRGSRGAAFGTVAIEENDYVAAAGDDILSASADLADAFAGALERVDLSGKERLTLYYNEEVSAEMLSRLTAVVQGFNQGMQVDSYYGGQKKFLLIVSVE